MTMDLKGNCFTNAIRLTAQLKPHSTALKDNFTELNYQDLETAVENLSALIDQKTNLNPGNVVVFGDNSVTTAVAFYSILRAGGTYVPISPQAMPGTINNVLNLVRPVLILVESRFLPVWKQMCTDAKFTHPFIPEIILDNSQKAGDFSTARSNSFDRVSDLPAYTLFTSGSTGEPKGISISRTNLSFFLRWVTNHYTFSCDDKFISLARLTFDLSMFDLLTPIQVGASLYIVTEKADLFNPINMMQKCGITVALVVPSISRPLEPLYKKYHDIISSLRTVFFCGERLLKSDVLFWKSLAPKAKLSNWYGPTEATVACCYYEIDTEIEELPIGTMVSEMCYYIIPEKDDPELGELVVCGPQVSDNGYLNGKSESFTLENSQNCYRTGDLVKVQNKLLYWIGRKDFQFKRKGHRIELEGLEVLATKALGFPTNAIYNSLTSKLTFLVQIENAAYEIESAEKILQINLPPYLLPDKIIICNKIPLNERGKIDRNRLREIVELADSSGTRVQN